MRAFHLGGILRIITGLYFPTFDEAYYGILRFMTGDEPFFGPTECRFSRECKPYLLEQFPQLATSEMDLAIADLLERLKAKSGNDEKNMLIDTWVAEQAVLYGETLAVTPLPDGVHNIMKLSNELTTFFGDLGKNVVILY